MKKLKIELSHRVYLVAKRALATNADGDEVLAGLTYGESVDYLKVVDRDIRTALSRQVDDPEHFLSMYERHTAAISKSSALVNMLTGRYQSKDQK